MFYGSICNYRIPLFYSVYKFRANFNSESNTIRAMIFQLLRILPILFTTDVADV